MTKSSFSKRVDSVVGSLLALILSALFLAGCGTGDGPESITNEPATPLPPASGDPFDSGLLTNGDFEAGVEPWIGNAANVVLIGDNFVNSAFVERAGQSFDVNLSQVLEIIPDETYILTFNARSDGDRTMLAGIGLNEEPFTNESVPVNLTAEWQTFVLEITAAGFGNANSRVLFDMGADTGLVLIDNVSLFLAGGGGGIGTPIDPDAVLYPESEADLVIPDDYAERTAFGSLSVIDPLYMDDETYSPVLSVFSGTGYGANIAQVGYIGFRPGFLGAYETVVFKVKGMPNQVIFVKLFDGVDALRINLTSSSFSEALTDDWFQVSIPLSEFTGAAAATGIVFESDDSSVTQFRMLLNDIGFSGVGDNPPVVSDPGIIPEAVVYASDPNVVEDLAPPSGIQNFGSGAAFDENYAGEFDFNPSLQVTSGEGYGAGVHVGFAAFPDYAAGFASGYETLHFKVKGDAANLAAFEVKFFAAPGEPETSQTYDATSFTDLGNGWYQASIPMSDFPTSDTNTGFLLGPLGAQAAPFSFLMTDIGFSGTVVDPSIDPEAVVYATDPTVVEDLAAPGGIQNFGSGAVIDEAFAGDADFNPSLQVTSGEGYGAGVHVGFAAFPDYAAGFAAGYENVVFKVKGDAANLAAFEVKFFAAPGEPETSQTYDATSFPELGNGWYQVSIPISDFPTVDTNTGFLLGPLGAQAAPFSFLMTDIGFTGTAADPSIDPDAVVYATDPAVVEDLAAPGGIQNFGSGAAIDEAFAGDADFNPSLQVISGEGYGAGVHVGFAAFPDYAAGFAAGYENVVFKVKGDAANLAAFEVKFFAAPGEPETSRTYDATSFPDLGNGWFQVSVPISDFPTVDTNTGFLLGPLGAQAAPFSFLMTDIGFTTGGG